MNYILKTAQGIMVNDGEGMHLEKKGMRQYLNELAIEEHVTYEGRIRALRARYGLKNNVPLYLSQETCLYPLRPLRATDAVFVNYFNVLSLRQGRNGDAEIIFTNLAILKTALPYATAVRKHVQTGRLIERIDR